MHGLPLGGMSLSEFHLTPFLEFVLTCTHVAFPAFICFNHSSCSENSVARQVLEFPPNVIPWPPGSAYHHLPGSTARTSNPAILPHSPFYSTAPLTNHMAYLLIMLLFSVCLPPGRDMLHRQEPLFCWLKYPPCSEQRPA